MLQNRLLNEMSLEDLNQRYKGTFVSYDDKCYYCDGFAAVDGDGHAPYAIRLTQDTGKATKLVPFFWEKLDISRPQSRWYDVADPELKIKAYPAFLSLSIHRQWARGLSGKNSNLWTPHYESRNQVVPYERILLNKDPVEFRKRISVVALRDALKELGFFIHSPKIATVIMNGEHRIFYRRSVVAKFKENGEVSMTEEQFQQEIREVLENPKISVEEQKPMMRKSSGKIKARTPLEWPLPANNLDQIVGGFRREVRLGDHHAQPRHGEQVPVTPLVVQEWLNQIQRGTISRGSVCPPSFPFYQPFQLWGEDGRQRWFQVYYSDDTLHFRLITDQTARSVMRQIDDAARRERVRERVRDAVLDEEVDINWDVLRGDER